jgi:nucleoside-diphosphate-sugar epimerase
MNALVTGGAGFIGSHVVDALVNNGARVRILDNFTTGSEKNVIEHHGNVEILRADLGDEAVADRACSNIDTIFHLAAIPSVQRSILNPTATQLNGEVATLRLLQAAVRHRIGRVVLASSCSVYGQTSNLPIAEDTELAPLSPYAASKVAVEAYGRAFSHSYDIDTVSLRFFNVFGPRQDPRSEYSGVISIFMSEMSAGRAPTVFGDGEQREILFMLEMLLGRTCSRHNIRAVLTAPRLM